jgi:hypothetical protein
MFRREIDSCKRRGRVGYSHSVQEGRRNGFPFFVTTGGGGEIATELKFSSTDWGAIVGAAIKAVGAGIGVLGFITFSGAALLWIRYQALDLPATYSVSVVPHDQLVATGAALLAPACVVALGLAAIIAFGKSLLTKSSWLRARAIWKSLPKRWRNWLDAGIGVNETLATAQKDEQEKFRLLSESHNQLRIASQSPTADLTTLSQDVTRQQAEAVAATEARRAAQRSADSWRSVGEVAGATVFLLATIGVAVFLLIEDGWKVFLLALLAGLVATAASYLILSHTTSLVWSILGLFAAAAVYGVLIQGFRTYLRPRIEPVALVLKAPAPSVVGALVAESGDVMYVAIAVDKDTWAVRRIERADITRQAVGPLAKREKVAGDADQLLATLKK